MPSEDHEGAYNQITDGSITFSLHQINIYFVYLQMAFLIVSITPLPALPAPATTKVYGKEVRNVSQLLVGEIEPGP